LILEKENSEKSRRVANISGRIEAFNTGRNESSAIPAVGWKNSF
jgi:hypothetical protein